MTTWKALEAILYLNVWATRCAIRSLVERPQHSRVEEKLLVFHIQRRCEHRISWVFAADKSNKNIWNRTPAERHTASIVWAYKLSVRTTTLYDRWKVYTCRVYCTLELCLYLNLDSKRSMELSDLEIKSTVTNFGAGIAGRKNGVAYTLHTFSNLIASIPRYRYVWLYRLVVSRAW